MTVHPHPNPIGPAEVAVCEALKNPDEFHFVWNTIGDYIRKGFCEYDNKGSVVIRMPGGYSGDPHSLPHFFFPQQERHDARHAIFSNQAISLGYRLATVRLESVITQGFTDYWAVIKLTFRKPTHSEIP